MSWNDTDPKDPRPQGDDTAEDTGEGEGAPRPVTGKRRYDLDPTRYGDWELNGRCIDF